jgi:hypothetical protein
MSNPETATLSYIERVVSAAIKAAIEPLERSIRYLNDSYGIVNECIDNECIDNEFIIDDKIGNKCIDNEFITNIERVVSAAIKAAMLEYSRYSFSKHHLP